MYSKTFIIENEGGVHARPATQLVNLAKGFSSDIELSHDTICIDPKSILSVLSGELRGGTTVTLTAAGVDEVTAVTEIHTFICSISEEDYL